jgi:hypothetical protein
VSQVGYLPELYKDASSEKYKKLYIERNKIKTSFQGTEWE